MNERDYIASMFIDNELSIDEKIEFVRACRERPSFADETVALLEQEKLLRTETLIPAFHPKTAVGMRAGFQPFRPWPLLAAALSLVIIGLSGALIHRTAAPVSAAGKEPAASHRFVLYEPSARDVEIAGSFTAWRRVRLEPVAGSGYWEIDLDLSPGSHSYTYILDGTRKIADPTVLESESDDFGGQNSILDATKGAI